jgi:hypothetical protein
LHIEKGNMKQDFNKAKQCVSEKKVFALAKPSEE